MGVIDGRFRCGLVQNTLIHGFLTEELHVFLLSLSPVLLDNPCVSRAASMHCSHGKRRLERAHPPWQIPIATTQHWEQTGTHMQGARVVHGPFPILGIMASGNLLPRVLLATVMGGMGSYLFTLSFLHHPSVVCPGGSGVLQTTRA